MHHGFTYRAETETKQEDSSPDPLDPFPRQHQRQQQDQLLIAPGPSTSTSQSPFRVRLAVPPGFNIKNYESRVDEDGEDEFEPEDADADGDDDPDADASIDENYITELQHTNPSNHNDEMVNARDLDPASDDVKPVRRSTRRHSQNSGSEYTNQTGASQSPGHANGTTTSSRGRTRAAVNYNEDLITYGEDDDDDVGPRRSRSSKSKASGSHRAGSSRRERDLPDFVEPDPDEERRLTRLQVRKEEERARRRAEPRKLVASDPHRRAPARLTRNSARGRAVPSSDDEYAEDDDGDEDEDDEAGSDAVHTTPSPTRPTEHEDEDAEGEPDHDEEPVRTTRRVTRRTQRKRKSSIEEDEEDRAYSLRPRGNVDYRIPMPLEDLPMDPKDRLPPQRPRPKGRAAPSVAFGTLPFPPRGDDSDSDGFARTPRRPLTGAGGAGNLFSAGAGGSMFPSDLAAAAGTPSNLGRVGSGTAAALADVDPLGVNQNVTFDEVGGLDEHIASLKEMTLLPLLYPELFQRFNVTPPRGVLFHGPPGTGKTLLARALAASCRSGGRQIAFFMRKGADCLSKWVGEAERQLRLLFEEARASQPAIIFFDEIDGLAPVRSAKQDQIHASIVSTLLALMDGMDGRGQVIVIGATNRPDAIDPALRRPGRFDREFYFPLPNITARERILRIHTKGWDGWEEGDARVEETIKGLAKITKGYGGADLRALCTEAALNAVQRRYPQIYGSSDRLVVKPETVRAEARDFMVSIKKMVPSSARSASSTASPLPAQLVPLLEAPLNNIKAVLNRIIPPPVKRSVLEEAQWEEEPAIHGGELDREMMMQNMESLRIHRPRLVIHGPPGMGQGYLGAAALHHLEAFNVQSLDLGALMSDASQSIEASIVHLFVEAKRNQPSIVYIPSLLAFCAAVSDTALTTTRSMLDGLAPTDPVLLLAVVDGPWSDVPREVRSWFGFGKDGRIALEAPSAPQRERFFGELMEHVRRPPSAFPGATRRRKRALEVLPVAPPLAPRQPTEAELRILEENDDRIIAQLKHRLNPVLLDLKRRFKRFTKAAEIEYGTDKDGNLFYAPPAPHEAPPAPEENPPSTPNGMVIDVDASEPPAEPNGIPNGHTESDAPPAVPPAPQPASEPAHPPMHLIDLERIHVSLYNGKYLTPIEFLEDVHKIVQNADNMKHYDSERFFKAQALYTTAEVHTHEFEAPFVQECLRMATREHKRRDEQKKLRAEAKKAAKALQESQQPQPPPGARRSARNNGQEPELAITDPVELERRLKRQRSTESAANGSPREGEDEEGRASKRQKTSEPVDVFGAVATPTLSGTSEAVQPAVAMDVDLVAGGASNSMLALEPVAIPTPPSTLANLLNPAPASPPPPQADVPMEVVPQPEPAKDPTPPPPRPRTPSPSPGPPPVFHLSASLAAAFQAKLTSHTGGLTVEQLEQLRAACFDCVWRHRSDWDRDGAVHEMDGIVDEFLSEVALDDQQDDVG